MRSALRNAITELFDLLLAPRFNYADRYELLLARVTLLICLFIFTIGTSLLVGALTVPTVAVVTPDLLVSILLVVVAAVVAALLVHSGQLSIGVWIVYLIYLLGAARALEAGIGTAMALLMALPTIYAGIVWRWRGVILTVIIELALVGRVLALVAQGQIPPFNTAMMTNYNFSVLLVIGTLGGIALLTGAFAFEAQRILQYSNRLLTQLRGVLDISQVTARITDLDELLPRLVNYVRDRFGIYHVQIFLVDRESRFANLVASTGDAGNLLLDRGYRLAVASPAAIGQAIRSGQPFLSTGEEDRTVSESESTLRFPRHVNELLPATRSELVLPLIVGDQVIGALDLQSTRTRTFSLRETDSLRLLATQIALAIYHAQQFQSQSDALDQTRHMYEEAEKTLRESQQINQRLTGQAWKDYLRQNVSSGIGYTFSDGKLHADTSWTPALERVSNSAEPIVLSDSSRRLVAVPIQLRGQVIGAIEVELEPANSSIEIAANELAEMTQAIAQRLAVSVDNARLFEQTQELAQQEFELNSISSRLQGYNDVQELVKVALHELSIALDADRAAIRLGQPTQDSGSQPVRRREKSGTGRLSRDTARMSTINPETQS
ncbi:MAG: GAF domain-containing protein [Anaerolineae bacterium]